MYFGKALAVATMLRKTVTPYEDHSEFLLAKCRLRRMPAMPISGSLFCWFYPNFGAMYRRYLLRQQREEANW